MTTAAQHIEQTLARSILRGERAPGDTLPTVRALAAEFGVTVPTVQRAVARLAATGLVQARQGSGITVLDPLATGDLRSIGDLLEASVDQTDRVAPMLADFLELRRVLAAHLIRTRSADLLAALPTFQEGLAALAEADTVREIAVADAALTGLVVQTAGNQVVQAVFGAVERLAVRVPAIAEAIYGDRDAHRATMSAIVEAIRTSAGDPDHAAMGVDRVLSAWDAQSVARFREGANAPGEEPNR